MSVKIFASILLAALLVNFILGSKLPPENVTDSDAPERRIINGDIADPSDFRYLVRLHKGDTICGGNIIASKWILTAAYCTFKIECSAIQIFSATWEPNSTPTIHGVSCFTPEEYPRFKYAYEISIINTNEDLLADAKLAIVPLPPPGANFGPGTEAVIAGWGESYQETKSNKLLKANVRIQGHEPCNDVFKRTDPKCATDSPTCPVHDIPNRVLCTDGAPPKLPGICHGDSGGPLLIDGVLAGITIASIVRDGKCVLGSPSIYTNVADYLPWIYSFIDPEKDTSGYTVKAESTSVTV